jgi:hypothetical protein
VIRLPLPPLPITVRYNGCQSVSPAAVAQRLYVTGMFLRLRGIKVAALLACLLVAWSCASAPVATSTRPDASTAVDARAAIDATEAVRVAALTWAVGAKADHTITAAQYARIVTASRAVESGEVVANIQLKAYLAGGSAAARESLRQALVSLAAQQLHLLAEKEGH